VGDRVRLAVIRPAKTTPESDRRLLDLLSGYVRPYVELSVVSLDEGPPSLETEEDVVLASPGVVAKARELQGRVDGMVVDCTLDPGVAAAREVSSKPVVGAGEAAFTLARLVADRFSIVTVTRGLEPIFWRRARLYGLESCLCSVRSIGVHVLELEAERSRVMAGLLRESRRAVEEDGAHAIFLGCTGLRGVAERLAETLDCPVVDPTKAMLQVALCLIEAGLSHSPLSYHRVET
jgi:allantoin racemase